MASDDGTIRIGTEVDISGIQDGMKEAQATVESSTSEMQSAYERLAAATAEYAVTTANLRNSIAQVVTGQTAYSSATAALTPALMENTAAANALRDAKAALVAIETEETAVVRGGMSARMAATAEMRIAEGNIQGSTRAAAAFLTTIPGVGEAMQSAFAVFGVVALAGVVVDLGQKLYTAFDIGGERARKTQQDIAAVTHEIERSTTSLNVQIDQLQQEQAKLERVPFNGIKLVLDEAAEAAQKLAEQLDQVRRARKDGHRRYVGKHAAADARRRTDWLRADNALRAREVDRAGEDAAGPTQRVGQLRQLAPDAPRRAEVQAGGSGRGCGRI